MVIPLIAKLPAVAADMRSLPDFVSMSPEVLESVGREREWFEFKLLRQFQTIYQGGLGGSRTHPDLRGD